MRARFRPSRVAEILTPCDAGNRAVCAEPRKFIKEHGIKSERFIGGTSFDRFAL
jgi:hypothetical protein